MLRRGLRTVWDYYSKSTYVDLLTHDTIYIETAGTASSGGNLVVHGLRATERGEPIGRPLVDVEQAPVNDNDAVQSVHKELWTKAMAAEYAGIVASQTFQTVTMPKNKKVVESKCIYHWKANNEGEVIRAKTRIVAKGFSEVQGVGFDETLVPCIRSPSRRLVLAIAVQHYLDSFIFMLSNLSSYQT